MFELKGEGVDLEILWSVSRREVKEFRLAGSARARMLESRKFIEEKLQSGEVIYGVNTGFGALSSARISQGEIVQLQKNLIRSHCCGVGSAFSAEETRAILFLRANALARGHSGVRPAVAEKLLEFLVHDLLPVIPKQGSVGASGDLAPLAHLALGLIGEGEIRYRDEVMKADQALKAAQVEPLSLQAKEGLSLINGCQVMTAVGLLAAGEALRLVWLSDLAGAMSVEAMRGTRTAFDPLISASRPHPGEAKTARNLLKLLGPSSEIAQSHADCDRVQDAYSLRCMPAVHGATKDALRSSVRTLEIEANSSTDNPLVFVEEGKVLSGGNFHGEPVAFALDFLGIAIAAQASISECRIEKLINPAMSGLPPFLAPQGGLNSGHMIVHVAAASLVSENKILAHPASVDSIPTSADKEDHVSMGTIAARKLGQIVRNAENILAMEFLSATQALDLLKPHRPASAVAAALDLIRETVPYAAQDRVFAADIAAIRELIRSGALTGMIKGSVGELEW